MALLGDPGALTWLGVALAALNVIQTIALAWIGADRRARQRAVRPRRTRRSDPPADA